MPTVSVIIPTHNRPGLLKLAVASVEAQTYRDFELIVIDDTEARGGGWARNRGIKKARGKFISRAVDVAEVAAKRFLENSVSIKDIKVDSEEFTNKEGKQVRVSSIEITLVRR